ncbi:MAG TPA: hypothetical protein VMW72_24330 [Sedimentisphaerales bacterium]|nr:hypothetical protein [Sedimentisphaerales bacterium]
MKIRTLPPVGRGLRLTGVTEIRNSKRYSFVPPVADFQHFVPRNDNFVSGIEVDCVLCGRADDG